MSSQQVTARNAPVAATVALVVLGVIFAVVAVVYFVDTANALPSVFPGHQSGSNHHHTKHAIAATALAIICFVGAWFTTGKRSTGVSAG